MSYSYNKYIFYKNALLIKKNGYLDSKGKVICSGINCIDCILECNDDLCHYSLNDLKEIINKFIYNWEKEVDVDLYIDTAKKVIYFMNSNKYKECDVFLCSSCPINSSNSKKFNRIECLDCVDLSESKNELNKFLEEFDVPENKSSIDKKLITQIRNEIKYNDECFMEHCESCPIEDCKQKPWLDIVNELDNILCLENTTTKVIKLEIEHTEDAIKNFIATANNYIKLYKNNKNNIVYEYCSKTPCKTCILNEEDKHLADSKQHCRKMDNRSKYYYFNRFLEKQKNLLSDSSEQKNEYKSPTVESKKTDKQNILRSFYERYRFKI